MTAEEQHASSDTHVRLASLTLILGLARSSLSRELCSVNRRSLSSCIDILWGRDCSIVLGMLDEGAMRKAGREQSKEGMYH